MKNEKHIIGKKVVGIEYLNRRNPLEHITVVLEDGTKLVEVLRIDMMGKSGGAIIQADSLTAKEIKQRKALLKSMYPAIENRHDVAEGVKMVKNKSPLPPKEILTVSGIKKTRRCSGDWVDSAIQ